MRLVPYLKLHCADQLSKTFSLGAYFKFGKSLGNGCVQDCVDYIVWYDITPRFMYLEEVTKLAIRLSKLFGLVLLCVFRVLAFISSVQVTFGMWL